MPRTQPLFSVVIPTLNEGDLLRMTVESILANTRYANYEVLIVDDGSTDGSSLPFVGLAPRVQVITTQGIGVARARNLGARHARGEFVTFLDAHCRVPENWLDGFQRALAAPDVCLAGPCFTKLEQPLPRGCGMVWGDYRLETSWYEPVETDPFYEVPLTPGGCHAFRTETFHAAGGYEEGFTRWGFEDVEICLRAWLLGYRVVVSPAVTIAHYFRESRNYTVSDLEITYNFLRMIHLHFSPRRIRQVLRAVAGNPFVCPALDRLYASDVFAVRHHLDAVRRYDDDWFFRHINPLPPAA